MVSKLIAVIRNLSMYFVAALVPMLLSLLINPFLARELSPSDYAIIGYYGAFNSFFQPVITFYLLHYYTKRYFELDEIERRCFRATIFKALIFFSLLLAVLCMAGLVIYHCLFNSDSTLPIFPYVVLSVLPLFLTGIYMLQLVDFRMSRKPISYLIWTCSNALIGAVLAIAFVVCFRMGAYGRMLATLVAASVVFAMVILRNLKAWHHSFEARVFLKSLVFCSPLVLASVLTFFSTGYEKVILERLVSVEELGVYSVAFSIAAYLHVFSTTLNDTFQPDIYKGIATKHYLSVFKYIVLKLVVITCVVLVFIALCEPLISILTFGRYVHASSFARILALSSISSMLYYSVSQVTVALGYTNIALMNKVVGSLLCIFTYSWLIHWYGAIGAAWGVVVSYLYFFVGNIIFVLVKRKFKTA